MGNDLNTVAARGHKKKDRHAYHNLGGPESATGSSNLVSGQMPPLPGSAGTSNAALGTPYWDQRATSSGSHSQSPALQAAGFPSFGTASQPPARQMTPLIGTPASSTQGRVDQEQIPSIPVSRDAPAQYYLSHVYPTMEQRLPPPASVPFMAVDQGNSSPKLARLTLNNIPNSADALSKTGLPLGLILQPLAALQEGEQHIPVIDFGDAGPPRCRRCRTFINPFMMFRSGGNKFECNMCTFPNDVPPEYFSHTDPSGVRVDRAQRPELMLGTVDFTVSKEYWTKKPVPMHWLFLIDASMEAVSKGFLDGFCRGIRYALYGDPDAENDVQKDGTKSRLSPGARVAIATYDKQVHFYNLNAALKSAQMIVMSDIEEPFVPLGDAGLFADPTTSRDVIISLLDRIPGMFSRVKAAEPALYPALTAALAGLMPTGGKMVCSLAALPTWGPGRLYLRDKPELRDTDQEKKLFTTEQSEFRDIARKMTENGVGIDFFLAAPQGGYLDIATIGHVSEKTGGEIFYYPNFHNPRDNLRLGKELEHTITRDTGCQALMKVRCSNGLQVAGYFGNFTQHTFGADLEFGVIDADKAIGVLFSYDGKLDSKLDAHFQSALLYTTSSGERRVRCCNLVASVRESAIESMKFVDQDAIIAILAKQAATHLADRQLRDVRNNLTEKTIDALAAYRKNFSGSHPPGQLVLPENLKEFSMYMLGLIKSRALKAGQEPTDRRVHDAKMIKAMGCGELSVYLYPRIIAIHSLADSDGFPNERGFLQMPPMVRASFSRVEEGGAYIVDCGSMVLLWLHAQVSPNLLEDLFGEGKNDLRSLDPFASSLPVLETHLSAQVRNILQYLETNRGSKALTIQLARQGLDGAEYEFARLLYEDRNNEAQSYVDWLVHVHRHINMEVCRLSLVY